MSLPTPTKAEIRQALGRLLPAHAILADDEQLRPYECDGLSAYTELPLLVVLPETEAQIQEILAWCARHAVPIVPRGAGTGLSGGAQPLANGIVLSTARLNRILKVDPAAAYAVVQPGVRNLAISHAVAQHDLYYAPDPSSQIACTIGGNVAENAGGVHCLKYGLTLHNVLGLRVILSNGELLEVGGLTPDAPGLDLLPLLIGSEGMLAIVTEVTLKLTPKPMLAQVIMASFASVAGACDAVAQLIAAGILPAGLELMDKTSVAMVEPFVNAGYDQAAAAILLCEADGTQADVALEVARMSEVLQQAGSTSLVISTNEQERLRFWSGRKNAFPAAGRISPDYYCMDGTIPRKHLSRVLLAIEQMQVKYGLRCANVFHAGDGNLHPLILFDANQAGELDRAVAFGNEILALCVEVGGSITGEHGVGIEKLDAMCAQFNDLELACFFAIKHAFDEAGILNPNKAIPTLTRCAEYGREHVRYGQRRFADLERY